jgi:catechol 2,3-dioxygenase-like lactoylglutathione lyase family enzyme
MTLSAGINHIAIVTQDLDRFLAFYAHTFDAKAAADIVEEGPSHEGLRHAFVDVGGGSMLHAFEMRENPNVRESHDLFARGHLDHFAINAADADAFETLRRRLVDAEASDGTVTDFGRVRTVAFTDPDGYEGEVALWQEAPLLMFDERLQEPYVLVRD